METIIADWHLFRRALQDKDKDAFDKMMNRVRAHVSASSYTIRFDPVESMFISILLEHEKEIMDLKSELEELRTKSNCETG
jgi:hypothetical protein